MENENYDKAIEFYQMWLKAEPVNKQVQMGLKKARMLADGNAAEFDEFQKKMISQLIKEIHEPTSSDRFAALNGLIDIGEPAVGPLIEELSQSNNWQIAKALGAIEDKRAVGPLLAKWKQADFAPMNDVIVEALESITGKSLGNDRQKWQEWWKREKNLYTPICEPISEIKPDPEPIHFDSVPYFHGETLRLKLTTPVGMEIGQMVWQTRSIEKDGRNLDRIESWMHIVQNNMQQYTAVDLDPDTLEPQWALTQNWAGRFEADYQAEKVLLTTGTEDTPKKHTLGIPEQIFDNEQALYVIRSLPLEEGYKGRFNIFPVQSGSVAECRIEVTGVETLTAMQEEIECFAVTLSVYQGTIKGLEHRLWISTDDRRLVVKYDAQQVLMELINVSIEDFGEPELVEVSEPGAMHFLIPSEWEYVSGSVMGMYETYIQLMPPRLICQASFISKSLEGMPEEPREIAEIDAQQLKGFFTDYAIRESSWNESPVSGLKAASYVADYMEKDKTMVEYRTYIVGNGRVHWFVFRASKEDFDTQKETFDFIVDSFSTGPGIDVSKP